MSGTIECLQVGVSIGLNFLLVHYYYDGFGTRVNLREGNYVYNKVIL